MKHAIAALALFIGFQAHAAVTCNVNALTGKDTEYGKILVSQEMSKPILVAIKNGEARTFEVNDKQDWKALDGSLFISVSRTETGLYGVATGRIDLKRTDDILPIDQITTGTVGKDKPLGVELRRHKLNVMCFEH